MEAEANLREAASFGMVPLSGRGERYITVEEVNEACLLARIDLNFEIAPSAIRFTMEELQFLTSVLEAVVVDPAMQYAIIKRLRHRVRTVNTERNKDRRVRKDMEEEDF
jgi:hypothetical protein